jgi:hypothetical protein
MNLDKLMPLLAAVAGGLLTITGGVVSTSYVRSMTTRAEDRQFIRAKIEDAYRLTIEIREGVGEAMIGTAVGKGGGSGISSSLNRLEIAVRLFHPALSGRFKEIREAIRVFYNAQRDFVLDSNETKRKELFDASESVDKACDLLHSDLVVAIGRI